MKILSIIKHHESGISREPVWVCTPLSYMTRIPPQPRIR